MLDQERVLLPTNIRPERYRITLTPDLNNRTFTGQEEVEIEVCSSTDRIVLHAVELEFHEIHLQRHARVLEPIAVELDEDRDTATLTFGETLSQGPAVLRMGFSGTLNDQMRGFYRSIYRLDGEERNMAVTQFEATDARRAFPCWDEPSIKATFAVTLVIPPERIAISNSPIIDDSVDPAGRHIVRFAETPVMSTYLLAFIVGEFDYVETQTPEGVVVRVYTPVGKAEQGRFALDVAARTLSFFHEYFGIPYPLPKMDLIAIADFAAGAMENWGAVTYRETAILVDPRESSAATRQRVAIVIAHELAHQWFGNLVTMEWWTHLWLNEGFASWIEYLAVDELFPEWGIWTQFVYSDFSRALGLDSLKSTHPIEVEVKDPNEISEIFDAISYSKGASVIRMLAAYLGEAAFRRGLRSYLERHQYSNATTEDLWQALAEASGKPVKSMMDTWTKQAGYPVLAVEENAQGLNLTQSRFFLSGEKEEADPTQWSVPVEISVPGSPAGEGRLLEGRSGTVPVPGSGGDWIKINPGQTGFYRVNYSPRLWGQLRTAVASMNLEAADRMGLQNDAFALARAGYLPTTRALGLATAYRRETDYTVWADLSSNLQSYKTLLGQEDSYDLFCSFGRDLYQDVYDRLGWEAVEEESHLTRLLRTVVIDQLGGYGGESVIREALRRFELIQEGVPVPPDLRVAVYRLVVEYGTEDSYRAVCEIFRQADMHEEKIRCLRALGASRDVSLLEATLRLSLSSEVRAQDTPFVVASVASNRYGRDVAWEFLKQNWSELDRRYGKGGFLLGRIISSTTEDFTTLERAREVEAFFQEHPAPAAARTIRQSVERIRSNALWLERDRDSICAWLERYRSEATEKPG